MADSVPADAPSIASFSSVLLELLALDVSSIEARCDGCGAVGWIETLTVYGDEMGFIGRCPGCESAVLRLVRVREHYWLDARGTTWLRFKPV